MIEREIDGAELENLYRHIASHPGVVMYRNELRSVILFRPIRIRLRHSRPSLAQPFGQARIEFANLFGHCFRHISFLGNIFVQIK